MRVFDMRATLSSRLIAATIVTAFGMPLTASAQLAPVMGSHYAARAADTGFESATNSNGGYGASVPLDLPAVRGGLPVPVHVVYGGNQVGAAGMGWDVPLSFVFRSTTAAHHRPAPGTLAAPTLLSVTLGGEHIDLVRNAADTAWVARRDNAQIEVRDTGNGTMVMYDGNGLIYTFSNQPATAAGALDNGNMYLLTSIAGPGGNNVQLAYSFGAPTLPGGGIGLAINLASASYNSSLGNASCFKNQVLLNYDTASTTPLSMSILGHTVLTRVQKLTSIDVTSKATCSATAISLRRYDFTYQTDPDTQRFQLHQVTVVGQLDTPERGVTLPVATYGYGAIADGARAIRYQKTQTLQPPLVASDAAGGTTFNFGIAYTEAEPSSELHGPNDTLVDLVTLQNFIDLNGDGRPNFFQLGDTTLLESFPGPNGTSVLSGNISRAGSQVSTTNLIHTANINTTGGAALGFPSPTGQNDTLRQLIDINGDGRLDVVETVLPDIDHWIVHLNTPDTNPGGIVWIDVTIPVDQMRSALNTTGSAFGRVPLGRTTIVPKNYAHCYQWAGPTNGSDPSGWITANNAHCPDITADYFSQRTIQEFELVDVNGDGYPDFVYDASRVEVRDPTTVHPPTLSPGLVHGNFYSNVSPGDMVGSRDIKVLLNTAGAHLADGVGIFSSTPITLEAAGFSANGCGIARWESEALGSGSQVNQVCGFEDVNGDGIVDRVTSSVQSGNLVTAAALGTGDLSQPYAAGATLTLPGSLGRTQNTSFKSSDPWFTTTCGGNGGTQTFTDTHRTSALRDINGDGIPDYISGEFVDGTGVWSVYFGTGAGFSAAAGIVTGNQFELSVERIACQNSVVGTPSGLYDIDGDGQPDVVMLNADSNPHWDVYQLVPQNQPFELGHTSLGVPSAGRLISIDNGYGAVTRVDYRSAKEDNHGLHNVPYPEIVVGAEAVTDANFNFLGAPTLHAYGNATLIFDAVEDGFVFPGYQRTVSLVTSNTPDTGDGMATITDAYAFAPFATGIDATARFQRYLKVGRTSDVTTLSGVLGSDPWALLRTNISTDSRAIGGTHYDWSTRLLAAGPAPAGNERCVDMVFPYDYAKSSQNALSVSDDVCTKYGFLFQQLVDSWRGDPGNSPIGFPSSTFNVRTRSQVVSVDDFGRVTSATNYNDFNPTAAFNRTDDDQCIATTYANPPHDSDRPRVLNAPAQRIVTDCGSTPKTLAQDQFEYDGLTTGTNFQKVSNGFVTSHTVTRVDENGSSLGDIREFDAAYDAVGNLTAVTKTRGDGATRTTSTTYDTAFSLVPVSVTTSGTNADAAKVPPLTTTITVDPLTLLVVNVGEPNGTRSGNTFDGFDRVLLTTVTPPGGSVGVLSAAAYNGFGVNDTGGRTIVRQEFTDAVAPSADFRTPGRGTPPGRISTVYLDSLGRLDHDEVQLGADYQSQKLIVGQRSYDNLGRVRFVADPYPTGNFATPYGTTQLFNTDGTLRCSIRASGSQTFTNVTDEVNEVYPTCYQRFFMNHQELVETQDAASLLAGSPQAGVSHESAYSAIGQLLHSTTYAPNGGDNPLPIEASDFTYDSLGHLITMQRFHDLVANGVENKTNPVQTTWHYDSLGWLTELDEQGNSAQSRIFDSWGEVTQTDWSDSATATSPLRDHRSITRYDALGRITHREEQLNGSVDADTINDYTYDAPATFVNRLTPTNVLGRLASASAPTLRVSYSYDGLGRVNGLGYDDRHGNPHVEKHSYHSDGSPSTLDLLLHDTSFKDEQIAYAYDSAGRLRSVKYNDGTNQDLFTTAGSTDVDVFGRVRNAQYGGTATVATLYADAGRRLLNDVKITGSGAHTREISFFPDGAAPTFDPLGRERTRKELVDVDVTDMVTTSDLTYDALGRLATTNRHTAGATLATTQYAYDPLGNLKTSDVGETGPGNATLSYQTTGATPDRDRLCSIGYGSNQPPATCNVSYDGAGNTVSEPTRAGTRTFTYSPAGRVETIANGSTNAAYKYDAFGAVHQLKVTTPSTDARTDIYFGAYFKQRNEGGSPIFDRRIPVPGAVATRHGAAGPWTFEFGEVRGTRFVTDQTGAFVQDINYQPFGEAASTGAQPGTTNYANEQWNGGDLLQALGVVQVGARIYDPVIGRFLSRDPLFDAGNLNPYAFAANDPINNSDASGLSCGTEAGPCPGDGCQPGVNCPGDGGGGGGGSCDATGCGPGSHTNNGPSGWEQFQCAWGFKDCTPPPKTSTYTSSGGSAKPTAQLPAGVGIGDGTSTVQDRTGNSDRTCGGGLDLLCMSRHNPNVPGQAFHLNAGAAAIGNQAAHIGDAEKPIALGAGATLLAPAMIAVGPGTAAAATNLTLRLSSTPLVVRGITLFFGGGTASYLTYGNGYDAGEAAALDGNTLVLGKFPYNIDYVARTPGTVTLDVPFGWTPNYNAGYIRGFLDVGGRIFSTNPNNLTGTYGLEIKQVLQALHWD